VKNVSINVVCEGKPDTKTIECNVLATIGKLKKAACGEFDVPMTYSVYTDGVFLTTELLRGLQNKASISIAPSKENETSA
jgi:hypothetical protein